MRIIRKNSLLVNEFQSVKFCLDDFIAKLSDFSSDLEDHMEEFHKLKDIENQLEEINNNQSSITNQLKKENKRLKEENEKLKITIKYWTDKVQDLKIELKKPVKKDLFS